MSARNVESGFILTAASTRVAAFQLPAKQCFPGVLFEVEPRKSRDFLLRCGNIVNFPKYAWSDSRAAVCYALGWDFRK
jgi:hypothetical protein